MAKNMIVDTSKKQIIILNYANLTEGEEKEIRIRTETQGYKVVDKPKRKASPLSKLNKKQILDVVKGNKEAEDFYKKNADMPFMSLKKAMKDTYPELFTSENIIKTIPSIKK